MASHSNEHSEFESGSGVSTDHIILGAVLCDKHWEHVRSLYDEVATNNSMLADAEAHANGSDAPSRDVVIVYRSWDEPCGSCEAGHDSHADSMPCFEVGHRRAVLRRLSSRS